MKNIEKLQQIYTKLQILLVKKNLNCKNILTTKFRDFLKIAKIKKLKLKKGDYCHRKIRGLDKITESSL